MSKNKRTTSDESLAAIFKDESGELPDLNIIERRRFPRAMAIAMGIIGFLGLLIAATWAGFTLLRPFGQGSSGRAFSLNVQGPERVSLGEETVYFINWRNISSAPLKAADVRVSFPPEFVITAVEPRAMGDDLRWDLGPVAVGGRGTFTVKGIFTGALGKQTAIQAVGNYRAASDQGGLEALSTLAITYAGTVVQGGLDLPPKALSGDAVQVAYTVQNTGSVPLKDLEMRLTLPEDFISASSTGPVEDRLMRMQIGDLAAGATATAVVSGTYAAGVTGEIDWHAELGRESADGSFQPVHVTSAHMAVLGGDLSLKLVANGSDGDRAIGYGDLMHFTLGYQNASTEDLKDVVLRLRFDPISSASGTASGTRQGPYLQWDKIDISTDGSSSTISTTTLPLLVWDKSKMNILERVPPDQDGSVTLSLPAVTMASGSAAGFLVTAEASISGVGNTVLKRTVRTAPMHFVFRTDADVAAEARYYSEEGVPLGSGPLPPLLGQNTAYRISWTVTKNLHEIRDMAVSAVLPKNVTWPDKAEATAGNVAYDAATRKVTWTLNRLPEDVDEERAEFEVQLTPSEFDIGRFAELLGDTRFEAVDTAVDEPIIKMKPGLSTDLQTDEGAKNKGVVRRP